MASGNDNVDSSFLTLIDLGDILNNLIATGIWAVVGGGIIFIIRHVSLLAEKSEKGQGHIILITLIRHLLYWAFSLGALYHLFHVFPEYKLQGVIAVLSVLFMLNIYKVFQLSKFKQAGIDSVDLKIKSSALNYKKSLEICKTGLEFLGVGAYKLTQLEEFEQAINRCHVNRKPIKLLLSTPQNPLIQRAAKQAKESQEAFSNKVEQSLLTIKQIKEKYGYNIEVRFYPEADEKDLQQFRLMFINESICLVSYTAWGKENEDGSRLPQLKISNDTAKDAYQTFYYPFKQHFDRLWEESEIWDFSEYLSGSK